MIRKVIDNVVGMIKFLTNQLDNQNDVFERRWKI